MIDEKASDKKQHFGMRKLSIGVASVLLGVTYLGVQTGTVHADTTATNPVTTS